MPEMDLLAPLEMFRDLTAAQRAAILGSMRRREVIRGETLVAEGDPSDSLFIVLHGAFEVRREGAAGPIAQLHAGDLVGEIGFFAGTPRTGTVVATRDASVLALDRAGYDGVAREVPAIVGTLLAAVARRLGDTSARLADAPRRTAERTVAVVHGGGEAIPPEFFARLRRALAVGGARVIDGEAVAARFGATPPDAPEVTQWLDALEWGDGPLVYLADPGLTDWTRKCVRQADLVIVAARGRAPAGGPGPVEEFVRGVHEPRARRLVRVHDRRAGVVSGTSAWLARMEVFMHHHVALEDDADFDALVRFVTGRAVGFVAAGGGGYGPAHVGIHKAFTERGVTFDVLIGTSVGAAMLAGFAMLLDAERLDAGTHDIFVTSRSFKRWNWPRYSLLDHVPFDRALVRAYGAETRIEDCWRPFFAVATNVSTQRLELIRSGLLWKAVRASSAIPALLPPVYTEDGMMLVDGGVMDNAPLGPLRELKSGPNLTVHFGRTAPQRFHCRYEDIPGRWGLLRAMLDPFGRRRLPRAPGAASVLMRSLFVHQRYDLPTEPHDLLLRPPRFPGSSFLNFDDHATVFRASYEWARGLIDELVEAGDPRYAALAGLPARREAPAHGPQRRPAPAQPA